MDLCVLWIIYILNFSDQNLWDCVFIAHERSNKSEAGNETKLIAISFKVSFNHASVLARIVLL